MRAPRPRLTARGRLTVLHTGLVLTAGMALAAFTYVLMRENLEVGPVLVRWAPGGGADPVPPPRLSELRDLADEVRAETLSEFLAQTAIALAAVGLLAAGSSWLLAGRVLRPVREITVAAQRLSAEDLSERVPVTAPADDLARPGHGAAAAARDVTLRRDLRPAPVTGDPILLERMASNLVDNAIRYNHPGGEIAVSTGTDDGQSVLRVINTGRVVPPDQADALLDPFVRGGGSRTRRDGAGLGLSIARAVVVAHRGEIALAARPTGGLDVTVRLPADAGPVAGTAELGA